MRFEAAGTPEAFGAAPTVPENRAMEQRASQAATAPGPALEELSALQMQNRTLQVLVGELLLKNEQLRLELSQREVAAALSATATPQPPRQDR